MEALDVVEDVEPGLGVSLVLAPVHPLPLQHSEEALRSGIVRTATGSAHRAGEVVTSKKPLIA